MDARRRMLVLEHQPALALFLAEQIEDWDIMRIARIEELDAYMPAHAILLANGGDHKGMAVYARRQRMIGPIFSLVEPDQEVSSPLVALAKPLRLNVLTARLDVPDSSAIDGTMIGAWTLDAAQRSLVDHRSEIAERLTDKEFEILSRLLLAVSAPVTRDQLQNDIWRYHADASTHTVETHIWRLRQKIEPDPANPVLLLTEAEGYRLVQE